MICGRMKMRDKNKFSRMQAQKVDYTLRLRINLKDKQWEGKKRRVKEKEGENISLPP